MTVGGLDHERCYEFRVRATPEDFYYGLLARPSDWTDVTHWAKGQRAGDIAGEGQESQDMIDR